ncbi:TniQ family protein [Paenibacillus sp. FSL R7-0302]|uniref:TniQ family protein n=1 Tax=Paenibacillus sp. FSL R7-0302 TaxID=2921681 RepID=UPI0030F975FE
MNIYTEKKVFQNSIQPKSEESLTSFIFRMTDLNGCEAEDVWREISYSNAESKSHMKLSRFDYDLYIVDHEMLAHLLSISSEDMGKMTSRNLYSKFFIDPLQDFEIAATMLRDIFQTHVRKICPLCVKEHNIFKLIWQIKELDFCPEHSVKLKSKCSYCGQKINYSDNLLVDHKCQNLSCDSSLLDDYEKIIMDSDMYNKQREYFEEWNFLLYSNNMLSCEQSGLSMEQNLALKLLYIAQGQKEEYCRREFNHLSITTIKTLIMLIKSNKQVKRVRVQDLLKVSRAVGMSVQEFACLEVPLTYTRSICEKQMILPPAECLSPWCHLQKKKTPMHLSKERIESRNREEKVRYPYYYTCSSCFMRYAYHPATKQWEEIHGQIILISKILQMASEGLTRSQISTILRKNLFYISEVFGYLAHRKLLPDAINLSFEGEVEVIDGKALDYFNTVDINWRKYSEFRYKIVKEKYGWSLLTYSYYYADPAVQTYLAGKPSTLKKPQKKFANIKQVVEENLVKLAESEINISFQQVAATLNVSEHTLRRHGQEKVIIKTKEKQISMYLNDHERELRQLFDCELIKRRELEIPFLFKDVYQVLGHRRDYIEFRFPGLLNYIIRMIKEYDQYIMERDEYNKRLQIRELILDTVEKYSKLNVSLVARRLGVQYIHVAGYKKLKDIIKQEIDFFNRNNDFQSIL